MRYIVIACLALSYFLMDSSWFLPESGVPYLARAVSYSFCHASILHLLVNCLAIWNIFSPKRKDNLKCLLLGYAISILVYPISLRPVIGVSNVLFAVIGLRTPALDNPWWKNPSVVTFFCITFLMAIFPGVSAITHIASFLIGAAYSALMRSINSLDNDIRRADR